MHIPLKSAAQLSSLTRKKLEFERRGLDFRAVIERDLLPAALEYETRKSRRTVFTWQAFEIPPGRLQAMFEFLFNLRTPLSSIGESDLFQLHRAGLPSDGDVYRDHPVPSFGPSHEPVAPERIPQTIQRFMEWARSPSFSEMHPVQQMTLAQMRLYEICPFRNQNEATVSLFSYYFLLESRFLIPVYRVEELPAFYDALQDAFGFATEVLVSFNAQACERAYNQVLESPRLT